MVRKMAYVGFSYLLGLLFASFFHLRLDFLVYAVIIAAAGIWVFFDRKRTAACVCLISFGIAGLYYSVYESSVYRNVVKYDSLTIEINGVITEFSEYSRDIDGYIVKGKINGCENARVICYGDARSCRIGDEIYVRGKASVPKSDFLFDGRSYYKSKGIYLTVRSADEIAITPADRLPVKRAVYSYREYLYDRMLKAMDLKSFSVLSAILFGDKSGINYSTRTLLQRAGIGHIMAVSGVHMTVVCSFFWFFIRLLPVKKGWRFLILLVPVSLFAIMSGASASVLRASVMIAAVYGAELFSRRSDVMNSLGIAAVILTLTCPFSVRDPSLLLSFAGVIGIGAAAPAAAEALENKTGKKLKPLYSLFLGSACVASAVFPVSFLFFDEVSVVSPVSNVILIPFCIVILICGVITAATGGLLAAPLMKICALCCRIVLALSGMIGSFGMSYIPLGYRFTGNIIIIALITSAAVFAFGRKISHAALSASFLFGVCIVSIMIYRFVPSYGMNAAVLCDGKGSAAFVIHDKKNAAVIDLSNGGKAAEYVTKYLSRKGISRTELLVLTTDVNTSEAVYLNRLDLFKVGTVLIPEGEPCGDAFSGKTKRYDTLRECTVTMPDYRITFSGGNTIVLEINGYNIIACEGETDVSGSCDAVILYKGRELPDDLNAKTVICADEKARVTAGKDSAVFIGDSVIIGFYKEGMVSEVISYGRGF